MIIGLVELRTGTSQKLHIAQSLKINHGIHPYIALERLASVQHISVSTCQIPAHGHFRKKASCMQQATEHRSDTEKYSSQRAYLPCTNTLTHPEAVTWYSSELTYCYSTADVM